MERISQFIKEAHGGETKEVYSFRRIKNELLEFERDPPPGCFVELQDPGLAFDTRDWISTDDPLYTKWLEAKAHFKATIIGPTGTPYEGGIFFLEIKLPPNYPLKPPRIKFVTPIYHANIRSDGYFCADILNSEWSPALTFSSLLMSVMSLLNDPEGQEENFVETTTEENYIRPNSEGSHLHDIQSKERLEARQAAKIRLLELKQQREELKNTQRALQGEAAACEGEKEGQAKLREAAIQHKLEKRNLTESDVERQHLFATDHAYYEFRAREWTQKYAM